MPLDYSKGQIYVIRNTLNDNVYVGSTTQTISRRWAEHMRSMRRKKTKHYKIYRAIEDLGIDNFYIEFVEAWPCENKGQLCAREGHYIRQMDSVKNGYNDVVAGRTHKECNAICRERIREKCQSDNEYRENRLKKIREYQRERYRSDENFREVVSERTREYRQRKKQMIKDRKSSNEYRENRRKKDKERYHSDEKYREYRQQKNREYRLRKKEERMQGPAETELLELK